MRFISALSVGLLALASARPALAADPDADSDVPREFTAAQKEETLMPLVGFNLGAGLSIPLADAGDRFKTGGSFALGATYNFSRRLGVQLEYLYSGYNVQSNVLSSSGVNGYHSMQYGDLNALYNVLPAHPIGVYVLGGPGVYHRRVEITQFAGVGVAPYCDPWLFVCYSTPVAVEQVLGLRSRTDFGLNAGVGLSLRLFEGPLQLYAEARYHYIFGTANVAGISRKVDGQYVPIVFGIRL
jgi:opacity protein-like surface antigen